MDQPQIETLMLCNHAEAINGLLYISGGGWTDHWRRTPPGSAQPPVTHMAVAVTVTVPWVASGGGGYPLQVSIEDLAGTKIAGINAQLSGARPPGLPTGAEMRAALALSLELVFPKPGEYRVAAVLAGQPPRLLEFRVHDVAQPQEQPAVN